MGRIWEETFTLNAIDRRTLREGFGERGLDLLSFKTRQERHRHNNGVEEELYLLRRYLFTLETEGMLRYPLNLEKTESPDFFGACANETYGVEVSEATSAIDQREMTLRERSGSPSLLGTYGGRYKGGVRYDGNPRGRPQDRDLTADVLRAVRRKAKRIRKQHYRNAKTLDLLLYANRNSSHLAEFEDSYPLLRAGFTRWLQIATKNTSIRRIALIFSKKLLLFEIDGRSKVLELRKSI